MVLIYFDLFFYLNHKIKQVLDIFPIARKTLYNWNKLNKQGKLCNKIEYKEYVSNKYTKQILDYIKKYIINKDNFRMKNLLKLIRKNFNCSFNANNVYYALKKLGITYKKAHKVVRINRKIHKEKVKQIKKQVNELGQNTIALMDESHFELNMKPNRAWNTKGRPVTIIKNSSVRKSTSLILTVTKEKIIHYELHNTSVNKVTIQNYFKEVNNKVSNMNILLDNARVHHAKDLKQYMSTESNKLLYILQVNSVFI